MKIKTLATQSLHEAVAKLVLVVEKKGIEEVPRDEQEDAGHTVGDGDQLSDQRQVGQGQNDEDCEDVHLDVVILQGEGKE